jgi:hypothetical protein
MTKCLLSVIGIFPEKKETTSEWAWIDAWSRIWQIFTRRRNLRFRDTMQRLTKKHSGKDEPWISCGERD